MNEAGNFGAAEGRRLAGGDFDEIAEHVVVLDLEGSDSRRLGVARLQRGDDAPAFVAQRPRLVEPGVKTHANEIAVALQERKLVGERPSKILGECGGRAGEGGGLRSHRLEFLRVLTENAGDAPRRFESCSNRVEVARAAPLQSQSPHGAQHVRAGGERDAQ
jgi:hypothetical protein